MYEFKWLFSALDKDKTEDAKYIIYTHIYIYTYVCICVSRIYVWSLKVRKIIIEYQTKSVIISVNSFHTKISILSNQIILN